MGNKDRAARDRLEQWARLSLPDDQCLSAEQLAAYVLGTLSPAEQLSVAAHVRECPRCFYLVASSRPPTPRSRRLVATLLPQPLGLGLRAGSPREQTRQYVADPFTLRLIVAPSNGEQWRISGRIVRDGAPLSEQLLMLRGGRRRYEQTSDVDGFFVFSAVSSGRYTLSMQHGEVRVEVCDLLLDITAND